MGNITIKPVWSATVDEIIRDLTHWEDMDSFILMGTDEDGCIYLTDYQGYDSASGLTLKEALIKHGLQSTWRATADPGKDAIADELDLLPVDSVVLDWRDAELPKEEDAELPV